jgi:hypothetical protein
MDEKSNTVMGDAIADAAQWYEKSDWIGVHFTPRSYMQLKRMMHVNGSEVAPCNRTGQSRQCVVMELHSGLTKKDREDYMVFLGPVARSGEKLVDANVIHSCSDAAASQSVSPGGCRNRNSLSAPTPACRGCSECYASSGSALLQPPRPSSPFLSHRVDAARTPARPRAARAPPRTQTHS